LEQAGQGLQLPRPQEAAQHAEAARQLAEQELVRPRQEIEELRRESSGKSRP
jgi:hypothetical protein